MLAGSILIVLCVVAVPGVLGKHLHHQDSIAAGRTKKASTKSQKNTAAAIDPKLPHLRFRHAPPHIFAATEFGSAVLECEAWGNPPPTIHWLKDGKRVTLGVKESRRQDFRDEEAEVEAPLGISLTRSRLYLDCLSRSDEATYSCVAENAFLRINSDTVLTLAENELAEDNTGGGANIELCLTKKAFGSPARIYMWTHSRLEEQGSDVQLFCRSTGLPEARVLWVGPEDLPLTSGDKYQVMESGDLLIRDLTWADQGSYTCLAENERGTDKTSTYLYPAAPEKSN